MKQENYYSERNLMNVKKIRELCQELPAWFSVFLRGVEDTTSSLTRLGYCYDARIFLGYLLKENSRIHAETVKDITLEDIGTLTLTDLEIYAEYLNYYSPGEDDKILNNKEMGKKRKLSSLRSLFKYLYKKQMIPANPSALLEMPKIHTKAITRLTPAETALLIDVIESGEGMTERQKKWNAITRKRDLALVILFLTTGIRVSELVGLNIGDVDLKELSFVVTRKGGNQAVLYFDIETYDALTSYLEERQSKGDVLPSDPLFISSQNQRIGVRAVENLVKKYAQIAAPLKKISPHKLRSTYGTMLYQETGDIYLVADVLGHKDVNTTKTHYANMEEEHRRKASGAVKVRSDT